ncbi:CBS domain-containing protein [Desulfotomaculum arcticum]|uniref:CBS domain-containing protein n=1 Tax=Desulfotruncus arcticus DSM 17038 TaxID=1121424 RepID=A0A1I2RPS0_9FIRM|nr:CBS domain-containing protein [Desulfotruncus arcticus]SFG39841.1 CBS domain-containing protein [Desulfotomaculum arcticum] [Desulfotruncus arcticus DSM 17038]
MPERAKTVGDYMVPLSDYPRVSHNTTLHEAVNIISQRSREKGYRWLVVMDDDNEIAGFLTLRNIFEAVSNLAPKASGMFSIFMSLSRQDLFYLEGVQLIKDTPLKKCIKPLVKAAVHVDDPPGTAAELILTHRITITPVMDAQGNIVGIIRPIDLLPYIKELFDNAPEK